MRRFEMKLRRVFLLLAFASQALGTGEFARPLLEVRSSESTVKVSGLKAPVSVTRDERGIPYIEASTDEDLYFAQGYVTASDRLWQMDINRRTARGEMSEVLGKDALETDKRFRTFGFGPLSETLAANASPMLKLAL